MIVRYMVFQEVELKKKQAEEEDNAKDSEISSVEERSDSELSKINVGLDALEVAVKEIVDEKKENSHSNLAKGSRSWKERAGCICW